MTSLHNEMELYSIKITCTEKRLNKGFHVIICYRFSGKYSLKLRTTYVCMGKVKILSSSANLPSIMRYQETYNLSLHTLNIIGEFRK